MNEYRQKLVDDKEKNKKELCNYILGIGDKGATVKELNEGLGWHADTIRCYIKELMVSGLLIREKEPGRGTTFRYFWNKDKETTVEEAKEEATMPEHEGGVEIEAGTQRNCGKFCNQGDVVYCSSRKGDGEFFKYLVIVPWERKATVACVFQEGHPNVDLNNPEMIYIGDDPKSGEKLYADVTNICQRGYLNFGERVMHVEKTYMDDVKNRLARVMRIETKSSGDSAVSKLRENNARLEEQIRKLREMSKKCDETITELRNSKAAETNKNAQWIEQYRDLEAKYNACKASVDELASTNDRLREENGKLSVLVTATSKEPDADPEYVTNLEGRLGDAMMGLTEMETRSNCYKEQIEFMKQVVFELINNGGN